MANSSLENRILSLPKNSNVELKRPVAFLRNGVQFLVMSVVNRDGLALIIDDSGCTMRPGYLPFGVDESILAVL